MLFLPHFHCIDQCLPTGYALLFGAVLALAGCASNTPALKNLESAVPATELIPVTRYGRYTLVELSPTAAQQDLLLQIVDVSIPDTVNASVSDGLRHILQRSGYQLCEGLEANIFSTLPLPAAHYHLGPLMLRDALQTLAGPGWHLYTDHQARQICFIQPITPPEFPPIDLDLPLDITEEEQP